MQTKIEELKKARELRKEGKSLGEIAKTLGVSKGSASAWVRDVELTPEQIESLAQKKLLGGKRGCNVAGMLNKERFKQLRLQYQEEGRKLAREKDPDFYSGCMLYWAEGSKSRHRVSIINTDANLLFVFVKFLKKFFYVKDEDITINCAYYYCSGLTNIEVENYWVNKLELPASCLRKTTIYNEVRKSTPQRQERTKYGMSKIQVNDVRIVQMIYGALQEIGGFINEEWVQ